MVLFPNCKINLGLNIIRKREDGYHDLETIFYPIALKDALEAIRTGEQDIRFSSSGLAVAGNPDDNLCVKAYRLLKQDFPEIGGIEMHLHKQIPMGAGLGGGSADGAFALLLLNRLFALQLSEEQLIRYALQLGSDCPFFILNKPCFATGRGEKMQPVTLDLSAYRFLLINPGIHVSTAQAFAGIQPHQPVRSLADIIQLPASQWKELLVNDFEKNVASAYPEITNIKEELYAKGALYASMTGSGSTVYGLFEKNSHPTIESQPGWTLYQTD
jgi:4-diphosphocytidyl-2-C-methyl-D-erythritol kinase